MIPALQDIVTRYASQTGCHVVRRFGWDCHGLPVEYEIDKKLGEASAHTELHMQSAFRQASDVGLHPGMFWRSAFVICRHQVA